MYGFLLLLLSLYYLFSFFCSLRIIRLFFLFRAVYSRRSPRAAVVAIVTDDVSAAYTYIDPARRRSRRFALLFAKKLFRNKFTRAMTLVTRRRRACTRIFRT